MNRWTMGTCAVAVLALGGAAGAQHVDLQLSLLVDVSGSVDGGEYLLQRNGYRDTFANPGFYSSVVGAGNSIAVNFIEWSGQTQQAERVGWTVIASQADANAFAAQLNGLTRAFDFGTTSPGDALNFAVTRFANSGGITSDFQVIDVSGDGSDNVRPGGFTANQRNLALAAGVDQINGLAILADEPNLAAWYNANVRGGLNSFVHAVNSFDDFGDAIAEKINLEINQVIPLPGAAGLAGLGLGIVAIRRRRAA